jgi:hypothetical protein
VVALGVAGVGVDEDAQATVVQHLRRHRLASKISRRRGQRRAALLHVKSPEPAGSFRSIERQASKPPGNS